MPVNWPTFEEFICDGEPLMPTNQLGGCRVDDWRVISDTIFVLKSGRRWKDCLTV